MALKASLLVIYSEVLLKSILSVDFRWRVKLDYWYFFLDFYSFSITITVFPSSPFLACLPTHTKHFSHSTPLIGQSLSWSRTKSPPIKAELDIPLMWNFPLSIVNMFYCHGLINKLPLINGLTWKSGEKSEKRCQGRKQVESERWHVDTKGDRCLRTWWVIHMLHGKI